LQQVNKRTTTKAQFVEFFARVHGDCGVITEQSLAQGKNLLNGALKHQARQLRKDLAQAVLDEAYAKISAQRKADCQDRKLLDTALIGNMRRRPETNFECGSLG
jgi:ubiquinone biosynthesis protein UbiJ